MHAAAGSNRANALLIREASAEIARIPTRPVPGSTDAPVALDAYGAFEQNRAGAAPINLTMRIERSVGNPSAALHWLRVEYPQDLRAREGYRRFATPGGGSGVFELDRTST